MKAGDFPAYRRYTGIGVWFKITGATDFIEIRTVGSRYQVHHVHAVQFPEKQLIADMLGCYEGRWEPADPGTVEALLKLASGTGLK